MKQIYNCIALAACALSASAAGPVSDVIVERSDNTLIVSMNIDPREVSSRANREEWFRPVITNGTDSLALRPVLIAGRTRYYKHLRTDGSDPAYTMMRAGKGEPYAYSVMVPYQPWMEMSTLVMNHRVDGCCGDALEPADSDDLAVLDFEPRVLQPVLVYEKPAAEAVKAREVHGSAYIDFPVNQTVIYPDYRRNPAELAAIRATIDEVNSDADVTITALSIKGFASPEGTYAKNERLAEGRARSLVEYVRQLYKFPSQIMTTSWEAEDWNGLIAFVEKSNIDNRDAILKVITDNSLAPDAREWRLKKNFPAQYAFLLKEVYPALRHSDYAVNYTIRNYNDPAEIASIMATAPQKLSLEELFIYAQSLDKDSPEFREVMEVAVRMYPDDPVANLNAASTAISHGEYDAARAYIAKAGKSPEATYTAGVLEAKAGNYTAARPLLEEASRQGIADADQILAKMRKWGWID